MSQSIACVFCGGMVAADADICPHCGGPVKQKQGRVAPPVSAGAAQCPNCKTPVGVGDIVCTQCGTNLLTGKKLSNEAPAKQTIAPGLGRYLKFAAVLLLLLILAGALLFATLYLLRDPVGEARRLARAGGLAQASEVLQTHLERAPEDTEAQFLLGQIYWQGQQYPRAADVFEAVARQGGPRDRDAALLALLATERMPETEDRQRLVALMSTLVQQRYPNDGELLKLLALLRGMAGEFQGQREAIEETVLVGESVSPVLHGLARALAQDFEGAERLLLQAHGQHPEDSVIPAALGFVRVLREQLDEAITVFENALDEDAAIGGLVNLQLGLLYMQKGRHGKALPLLTNAKNERPDDGRAVFLHGVCLQENKLLDEALVAFERLASDSGSLAAHAVLQMAVIYLEQGNLDRAASMARRAGEAGLNTARQATIQGRIYALQGDVIQAEQAYSRAISMTPEYPAARLELGLLFISRGSIEAGLEELEYYLELAQAAPMIYRANEIEVLVNQIKQTR